MVTASAQEKSRQRQNDEAQFRHAQIAKAEEYNEALASGAVFNANANVATSDGVSSDGSLIYTEILQQADNGFMGRLRYDALSVDLPIYHGTSAETLERGVGHLEGTSFPVGGMGARSVLTAHRGLPTANLFNDLDKAAVNDTFIVAVLDQVYTYRVFEVKVIQPEESTAILAVPDRDLVTLVTCTPLGVNSHRILVTAERITPTPLQDIAAARAAPELPGFPWWAVIFGSAILTLGGYVWRSGRVAGGSRVLHPYD